MTPAIKSSDISIAGLELHCHPLVAWIKNLSNPQCNEFHAHDFAQLVCCPEGLFQTIARTRSVEGSSQDLLAVAPPQYVVWIPPGTDFLIATANLSQIRIIPVEWENLPSAWMGVQTLKSSPLLDALIKSQAQSNYKENEYLHAAMMSVLKFEISNAPQPLLCTPLPSFKHGDIYLQSLCWQLLDNPAKHKTLAQWAAANNSSERNMARLFQNELGMSYKMWKLRGVIARALVRLSQGNTVAEISFENGYASESAFSAMFKSALGVSPSHFLNSKSRQNRRL